MPAMRSQQVAGDQAKFVAVPVLPKGGLGDVGNRVPRQQAAVDALVSGDVANHEPEKRSQRWLMGTHQGAVSFTYLQDYLDEFTFRFNRRTSSSRGKLFYRLAQQAVQTPPTTYDNLGDHNP